MIHPRRSIIAHINHYHNRNVKGIPLNHVAHKCGPYRSLFGLIAMKWEEIKEPPNPDVKIVFDTSM